MSKHKISEIEDANFVKKFKRINTAEFEKLKALKKKIGQIEDAERAKKINKAHEEQEKMRHLTTFPHDKYAIKIKKGEKYPMKSEKYPMKKKMLKKLLKKIKKQK